MLETVAVPVWILVAIGLFAALTVLDRLLLPSVRWFFRRRINRVLGEVRNRLDIDIPSFSLTKRQVLIDRLMFDPHVQAAAGEVADETGKPREVILEDVRRYAREIVPAFNAWVYFRIGFWFARRLSQTFYRVRLGYADDAGLRAIPRNSTPVFVINHRSNMDYVLAAFMAAEKTALSYAVGEWARIWPLQSLVRMMGGFFVRRNSGNALYRKVLERYVNMATDGGVPQAVFPEGGLSRDGGLRPPRLGLLDYILRGFDQNGGRDVYFIPVGINYDRVVEDRSLLLSLDPERKRRSKVYATAVSGRFLFHQLALALRGRWFRFGYAVVNFGSPVSLKEWLATHDMDLGALSTEERFAYVEKLAGSLMGEIAGVIPVVPVALIATVFQQRQTMLLTEGEVQAAALGMMAQFDRDGALTYIPRADRDYAIRVGLRMLRLRKIVDEEDGFLKVSDDNMQLLNYYANSIAHLMPEPAGP